VAATVVAIALYLSTAFSFSSAQIWAQTRFAFAFAAWQRFQDWRAAQAKKKAEAALDRRRMADRRASGQVVTPRQPVPAEHAR